MADGEQTSEPSVETIEVAVQMTVFVLIILATIVGNSLICISVTKFRHLRTNTNFILLSLALTDLTMVVVMIFSAVTTVTGEWIFGAWCCQAVAAAGLTLSFISILHMSCLSIDRYIAIQKPFSYESIVTRRRVVTVLVLIWASGVVVPNIPLADFEFRAVTYGCSSVELENTRRSFSPYIIFLVGLFVVIPFAIICFSNAVVFKTAFNHARQLSRVEKRLEQSSADICEREEQQQAKPRVENHSLKREIKSAHTFALVVGLFLLCYIPFYSVGTYRKLARSANVHSSDVRITMWVAFANSFINPIVYGLRYSPFRKAFKLLCLARCSERRHSHNCKRISSWRRERDGTRLSSTSAL